MAGASAALTAYLIGAGAGALVGGFIAGQSRFSSNRVVAVCIAFSALMAVILASEILVGYWAVVLMFLMGAGTGVAAPSRDIMIRSATVAKLGQRSFGRVYGFTYCGMDVGQSLSPLVFRFLIKACSLWFSLAWQRFRQRLFSQRFRCQTEKRKRMFRVGPRAAVRFALR